jgi:hypothetical protein
MTVGVALVDPPRPGLVLADVVEETPLSPEDGVTLYEAVLADFFEVVTQTNAELLVNYPTPEMLPGDGGDPEAEIRAVAAQVLDAETLRDVRFEVQVGSTPSARIGNAVTHLLREEDESSALFLEHRTPLLERSDVDQAAIALRRSETVVGPAATGDVYLAGFTQPIDFADVLAGEAVENVVERTVDADGAVDFVRYREVLGDERSLRTVVSLLRARRRADQRVPPHTMAAVDELGLHVEDDRLVVDE